VGKSLASLGQSGEPSAEQGRRRELNDLNKRARARFYAAELALDEAMRRCTAECAGKPAAEWRAAIEKYEAEIHIYLKAAEMLPPGSKG
jgi:hypothetical protein